MHSGHWLLPYDSLLPKYVQETAVKRLEGMGVKVILNTRAMDMNKMKTGVNFRQDVETNKVGLSFKQILYQACQDNMLHFCITAFLLCLLAIC